MVPRLLMGERGLWLYKHKTELHGELVRALCSCWKGMNDLQRISFASSFSMLGRSCEAMGLMNLLECLWAWPFALEVSGTTQAAQAEAAWALQAKIHLRASLERLLPREKKNNLPISRFMELWRHEPPEVRLDFLCTSELLLRKLQHNSQLMKLLVPDGPLGRKLHRFRRLYIEFRMPLHFFKKSAGCRPFFSWPKKLQTDFAEFWLSPTLTEESLQVDLKPSQTEEVFVRCCQLLLAMPQVESVSSTVDRLVGFCAYTLTNVQEGTESTQQAFLRGSNSAWAYYIVTVESLHANTSQAHSNT